MVEYITAKRIGELPAATAPGGSDQLIVQQDDGTKRLTLDQLKTIIVAAITGSAPETLNSLEEIAAALNNDPVFAADIAAMIAQKVAQTDFDTFKAATDAAIQTLQVTGSELEHSLGIYPLI